MITLTRKNNPELSSALTADRAAEAVSTRAVRLSVPPFTNLSELAADRPQATPEVFTANDFYGHAAILKRHAGFPADYILKATIEHGMFFSSFLYDLELQSGFPVMLVMSPLRYPVLRENTPKAIFALGPVLQYAPHALSTDVLEAEKQRLGRTLLAFPNHSTHHVTVHYDIDRYCDYLEETGRSFQTVRVCLYWKDILLGRSRAFEERGFECVTAGHIFDPQFLPRLKSIIELSTVTTSNLCGSHVGYCAAMGKPHVLACCDAGTAAADEQILKRDVNQTLSANPHFLEVEREFSVWTEELLPRQKSIVENYWGFTEKKSPSELELILNMAEDMHRSGVLKSPGMTDVTLSRALHYENTGRPDAALYLLNQLCALDAEPAKSVIESRERVRQSLRIP